MAFKKKAILFPGLDKVFGIYLYICLHGYTLPRFRKYKAQVCGL